MARRLLGLLGLLAGAIAGCGGGGGGSAAPDTGSASARVALSGTAVKGPMARAEVGVYAVGADGRPTGTALATAETGDDGGYTLSFDGIKDQPYVVIVRAKAGTTHLDEVTGLPQALPVDFQLRALVIPASGGAVTTSATVTPFSEMAVAAAEKAAGGINAANARQAESTINQLLGFDPRAVAARSTATASSEDEKKLAVMLTAVSKLADDGKFGCAGAASGGEKTRCVVQALRDAASKDSIRLGSAAGEDAAVELSGAITRVLADDRLRGAVSAATLTALQANLQCTTGCEAAPVSTVAAIAAARKFFTDLASDWRVLFSHGGASAIATGAANQQAFKFSTEFPKLRQPVDVMAADLQALVLGLGLYADYNAGLGPNSRSQGLGRVPSNNPFAFFNLPAQSCGLYQDPETVVLATAPANARFIGCTARFYARQQGIANGVRNTYYRHGFVITPNPDGSFGWVGRTRETIDECTPTCVRVANNPLQLDAGGVGRTFAGAITPTLAGGLPTALVVAGDLPAAFARDGFAGGAYALENDSHSIALNVTVTTDPATQDLTGMSLTGTFAGKNAAGATVASLAIRTGQVTTIPVGFDARGNPVAPGAPGALPGLSGFEPGGISLDLLFGTTGARFEGLFSASDTVWDRSRTVAAPTKVSFRGVFSTLDGGVATDFLTGSFAAESSGYADFDATQPSGSGNRFTVNVSLVGSVTAPGRPLLRLAFGTSVRSDDTNGSPQGATLQYSSMIGGNATQVIDLTASPDPVTGVLNRFRLSEATARLSMSWTDGDQTVRLMSGDVEIGTLEVGRRLITFRDHTSMSLDFGL